MFMRHYPIFHVNLSIGAYGVGGNLPRFVVKSTGDAQEWIFPMVDVFTPSKRSWIMAQVRDGNTKPELIVRKMIHGMGYRFRLHARELPGVPDIVLPRLRKIVFVHGCFWHGHHCPSGLKTPKTNAVYWKTKLARNAERDARALYELKKMGWNTLVVWECQTRRTGRLKRRLRRFLEK